MKKCAIFLFVLMPVLVSAKIWTVDNTPGAGADSSSLQGLIDRKASAGDTIIVMPSNIGYGSLTLTRKFFIYSRGHSNNNLDRDRAAVISSLSFTTSGSNSSAGSTVKGLRITGGFTINVNNIHLQNCYTEGSNYVYQSNALIEGCVFDLGGFNSVFFTTSSNNNILAHNYIQRLVPNGNFITGPSYPLIDAGNSSNLFINNFMVELVPGTGSVSGGGCTFFRNSFVKVYNSILWSNVAGRTRFDTLNSGSAFKNNLTYSDKTNPTNISGTGNINDSMPSFEGGYNSSKLPFYSISNDMRLKSGSPGKNRGTDSTDIGLYGGKYNYSIVGNVPGIAVFDDFEVLNPIIKKGGTLRVRINARKPE
jgi:hypothetical protein